MFWSLASNSLFLKDSHMVFISVAEIICIQLILGLRAVKKKLISEKSLDKRIQTVKRKKKERNNLILEVTCTIKQMQFQCSPKLKRLPFKIKKIYKKKNKKTPRIMIKRVFDKIKVLFKTKSFFLKTII